MDNTENRHRIIVVNTMNRQDSIEALSEVLELLRIIKEYTLKENRTTEPAIPEIEEILTVSAVYNRTK